MRHSKTVIVVAGPTAAGKTAMAIRLAQHFRCEILSADSRQCYREMNIGVAKPSAEELQAAHHYFINSHSIHDTVNAGVYESYGLAVAEKTFQQNDFLIVVGGTGLYIKAFCEGIDLLPPVDPQIRKNITELYKQKGLLWLQDEVAAKDPLYYSTGETQNPQRLMRALEFVLQHGTSIRNYQQNTIRERPFNIIYTGVSVPRPLLIERIHLRIDVMLQQGLVEEVRSLLPFRHLPALQTVGYSEFFDYFDGKCTLEESVEQLRTNTRRYAKRQMTWFGRNEQMSWFAPDESDRVVEYVGKSVGGK